MIAVKTTLQTTTLLSMVKMLDCWLCVQLTAESENCSLEHGQFLGHITSDLKKYVSKISNRCTRGTAPKRVTCGGVRLRAAKWLGNTAPKKHRSGGEPLATLADLAGPAIEPRNSLTDSNGLDN